MRVQGMLESQMVGMAEGLDDLVSGATDLASVLSVAFDFSIDRRNVVGGSMAFHNTAVRSLVREGSPLWLGVVACVVRPGVARNAARLTMNLGGGWFEPVVQMHPAEVHGHLFVCML